MQIFSVDNGSKIYDNKIKKKKDGDQNAIFSQFLTQEIDISQPVSTVENNMDKEESFSNRQMILISEDMIKNLRNIQIKMITGKFTEEFITNSMELINYVDANFNNSILRNKRLYQLLNDIKLRLNVEIAKIHLQRL